MKREMKCKRCGEDEDRIKGFCSIMCQEFWYYEDEINDLVAENKRLKEQVANLAYLIHYPEHWDTACYPTLESALHEIGCSECRS